MGREGVLKMGQDDQLHLQKFRHVVLLTMRPDTQAAQLERVMEELAQLPRQIEQIKSYNVGVDASIDKGNATVAVVADFASVEDYEIYRDHEAHKAVIKDHIKPILAPGGRTAIQHFPTQTHGSTGTGVPGSHPWQNGLVLHDRWYVHRLRSRIPHIWRLEKELTTESMRISRLLYDVRKSQRQTNCPAVWKHCRLTRPSKQSRCLVLHGAHALLYTPEIIS